MAGHVSASHGPPASGTLLERDAELAALRELLEAAGAGHGGLVLVEGPPGVGKSALLEHATGMAREHRLAVLTARGHELERAFGWGVARSLFEARLAGVPEAEREELLAGPAAPARLVFGAPGSDGPAPAADAGFEILHALYWLAVRLAERAPLLLVVDDAQWADEPSLRFLVYLAVRLPDQPIAVLAGARAGGAQGGSDLLGQLASEPAARVNALAPLGASAVAELVRDRLPDAADDLCRRCFELTGGNPWQLRALLLAVEQQAPPAGAGALDAAADVAARSLARSVLRRLEALSGAAQALARGVAVFEDDAPLHLAAALTELSATEALAAADELARADVLRPGDPLGFTHPLVRAAVYGRLPFGERALTHRRAARLLTESGAASERVSAHLLESSPEGDAVVVEVLRATARRALAQGVPRSAVRCLERALREPPPDAARPAVLGELGRAEAAAGLPHAEAHLEAAIGLAGDPRQRASLLLAYGRVLHDGGRLGDACAAFRRGLDALGNDDGEPAADLAGGLPHVGHAGARPRGRGPSARGRDPRGRAARLTRRAGAREQGDGHAPLVRRAAQQGPRHRRPPRRAHAAADARADSRALVHVAGCLSVCDDYPAADAVLRRMFAAARRQGSASAFAAASQLRARQRLWTGPVPDAVLDARAAVDVWRGGLQMYVHQATYCLVTGLLEQDEPGAAERALGLAEHEPAPTGFFAAWRHTAIGRVAAHRGDDDAALAAFLATGRCLSGLLATNPALLPWRSEAGLAARRLGRHDQARELIAEELALAERFGAPRAIAAARRAAGLLERGDAAVEALRSAVALAAGCGARVEQARAQLDLGAAIRRAGRPGEARGALREAVALADAAGATALGRRTREELRLTGGRAPAPADGRADGLTPAERRVAELAAGGQSNRQIADALFVTVKSVEWHLGNVYRKLDIPGRRHLGAALGTRA